MGGTSGADTYLFESFWGINTDVIHRLSGAFVGFSKKTDKRKDLRRGEVEAVAGLERLQGYLRAYEEGHTCSETCLA